MTRKHFETVARLLALLDADTVDANRAEIDGILRGQNANYNSDRFWHAVESHRG